MFTIIPILIAEEQEPQTDAATEIKGEDNATTEEASSDTEESTKENTETTKEDNDEKEKFVATDGIFSINLFADIWLKPVEFVENGVLNSDTGENAAVVASGFSIYNPIFGMSYEAQNFSFNTNISIGRTIDLLDLNFSFYTKKKEVEFIFGQMKIPLTFENALSRSDRDYPMLSMISSQLQDYSLLRQTYLRSPFTAVKSYGRDLGVGLKGSLYGFSYFLYVGNGFGANIGIGGSEDKQTIFTNDFGHFIYAGRFEYNFAEIFKEKLPDFTEITIGAHGLYNFHDNFLLGSDERSIFSTKRASWSCDFQFSYKYLRTSFIYGMGWILEDQDRDGHGDYFYKGWDFRIIGVPIPDVLEMGIAIDGLITDKNNTGNLFNYLNITANLQANFAKYFTIDIAYKHKILDAINNADLKNDIFLISLKMNFGAAFDLGKKL
ncbi:MAG: hypothetical protein JXR63_06870 [Spirochaetales bacterium]|nr:hypothetical protein [Spirochaetales bacterium]